MDYTTLVREYRNLMCTGPVGVSLEHGNIAGLWNLLIMGPTGAGKSTFIEALGWKGDQHISSNHLDSFTQSISTYRVNNLTDTSDCPIRLVDSPGFADTRTSESAIVSMLKKWLESNGGAYFNSILYLIPITHARLPGSQRQVLKTFQALTGIGSSANITIITTMWDSIYGERALKRAEGTFKQLQDEIWKEYIDSGARIVKFHNTLQSALSNLNVVLDTPGAHFFHVESMVRNSQGLHQTPFGTHLYTDLQDRIQNLQSAQTTLQFDVHQAKLESDAQLQAVLLQQLQQIEEDLARFQKESADFGPPPGSTDAPRPVAAISATISTTAEQAPTTDHNVILPPVPDFSQEVVLTPPGPITAANTPPPLASRRPRSSSLHAASAAADSATEIDHPQQSRFLRVIGSMKCWGNAVRERHDAD